MKTLNAEQMGKIDSLVDDLKLAQASIKDKHQSVNSVIDVLNEEIEAYNTILQQIQDFRNEVADEIEAGWTDKEEDWFTSDEGEEQSAWKEEWAQTYPDSIDTVSEVEIDKLDHDKELLNLPQHA